MPNPNPSAETRFQPGQSGNPSGRPRSKPITDRLREKIEEIGDDGFPLLEAIVDQWLQNVAEGDTAALKELLARLEGKVPQKVEADVDGALLIRVEYADTDGLPPPPAPRASDNPP